jgi:hypothetical protein
MIPNTNDLLTQKFDLAEIEPVVAPVDKNIVDGEATDVTNEDALADFKSVHHILIILIIKNTYMII